MIYLAFETCFKGASVSLLKDGKVYTLEEKREGRQSDTLAEMTKSLLEEHAVKVSDLDFVVANKGPGSFTGVRIGLSFMEGVCFRGKMQKLFVSSSAVSLASFPSVILQKNLLVVVHAIRETFYVQRFSPEFAEIGKAEYLTLEGVKTLIAEENLELFGEFGGYDLGDHISNAAAINSENVLKATLRFPHLTTPNNTPFYLRSAVNF